MKRCLLLVAFLACTACMPQETNVGPPPALPEALTDTGTDLGYEATPQTTDSLEITVSTGGTVTGFLTVDHTIGFGSVHCCELAAKDPPRLLEFFDYDCPYCREHALTMRPWIDEEYVAMGKLGVERIYLPQSSWGQRLAAAALCAAEQEKFDALDVLLIREFPSNEATLLALVKKAALHRANYDACMKNSSPLPDTWTFADGGTVERVPAFRIGSEFWMGVETEERLRKIIGDVPKT